MKSARSMTSVSGDSTHVLRYSSKYLYSNTLFNTTLRGTFHSHAVTNHMALPTLSLLCCTIKHNPVSQFLSCPGIERSNYLFFKTFAFPLRPTKPRTEGVAEILFSKIKRPERQTEHSPPRDKPKNNWSYICLFLQACLNSKNSDTLDAMFKAM